MLIKYKNNLNCLENCNKNIKTSENKQRPKHNKYLEFNRVKFIKDFHYKISKIPKHKKSREGLNTILITSNNKMIKMERIKSH